MNTPPVTVGADATVAQVAEIFASSGVGTLPVCNGRGEPIAVVTDRDLVVRALGQGGEGGEMPIREVAETELVLADATEPIAATADKMRRHGLRRLPVVERDRVVGVVSRGDLARHLPARATADLHPLDGTPGRSDSRSGRWLFERAY